MEHRTSERRDSAVATQLQLCGTFDVVEDRSRCPPSRQTLEVGDRPHAGPTIGRAAAERRPDEPCDL
jgi:hypothetical protein